MVRFQSFRLNMQTPNLETKLAHVFALMEAREAAIRREAENRKLSRRRYWWQETEQTEQTQTPCHENP